MKKISFIIYLVFVGYIYCTAEECKSETDQAKCSEYNIEFKDFSCFKFSNEQLNERGCFELPDDTKNQISFFNITNGITKEIASGFVDYYYDDLYDGSINIKMLKKAISNKDEEAEIDIRTPTEEENNMIKSRKSCSYNSYGRVFNDIYNKKIKEFQNITDKNICFNSQQFPELKDLLECGYADIKIILPSLNDDDEFDEDNDDSPKREYHIKTCFFVPNDNLPNELWLYLKAVSIDPDFLGNYIPVTLDQVEYAKLGYLDYQNERRQLESIYMYKSYEIVVEDKNGKKVKFTSSSDKLEIISDSDSDGTDGKSKNGSNLLTLYISLIISLFLLFL